MFTGAVQSTKTAKILPPQKLPAIRMVGNQKMPYIAYIVDGILLIQEFLMSDQLNVDVL